MLLATTRQPFFSSRDDRLRLTVDMNAAKRRDDYFIGVRVLVGKASMANIPASVRVDSVAKSHPVKPGVARWCVPLNLNHGTHSGSSQVRHPVQLR